MILWRVSATLLVALLICTGSASADIAFPARLDVIELEEAVFEITFTLPIVEGRKLRAEPRMPPTCVDVSPREVGMSSGGYTSTWSVRCEPASLAGEAILVEGLLGTQTDLAFTLTLLDGRSYSRILRPSRPGFLVPEEPSVLWLTVEAVVSGVRRSLRHLSLWFVLVAAALLGQRPRELVVAASAFAGGHLLAQWLGGRGWLEVTTQSRDILVWVTVAVPAIRLAGGDQWRDWLRPLWPTSLFLGFLFGGAQPEALPTEGLSNAEQLLALVLVAIGVGLAVLLMVVAALEFRAVVELAGGGRWRERAQQVVGYLAGAIAVGMVLVLLVGVSVVGYKVFVGPPMDTSADGRRVIRISEQERSLVLVEMRGFLASVQQITAALAVNDMQQVAEQARRSGRAAQHAVPPLLIAKLPAPFKKMGFDTHAGFDQLALDAEQLGDREHSLAQLGELMQNCVVCHGAYRIDPEPEPQTGDDG